MTSLEREGVAAWPRAYASVFAISYIFNDLLSFFLLCCFSFLYFSFGFFSPFHFVTLRDAANLIVACFVTRDVT